MFDGVSENAGAAHVLADLSVAQLRAVTSDASPLCILAGAGAGKTRVLTRRIAYRVATGSCDTDHLLALTFTRRAASELGQRLSALGVRQHATAGTFHSVATAQLRRWWADRGRQIPTLLEAPSRLVSELIAGRPALRSVPASELVAQLAWAKARLVTPEGYEAAVTGAKRITPAPAGLIGDLFARYEHEKRRRGLVDFDDLLAQCCDAMAADARFAAAQHWRWRHVFVDEFQDLNPLQHRLLLAWLGPDTDLCIVGDPNQAIYGWNGADPGLLAAVPTQWPTTEVIRLDDNYRCSPQVVAAGRAVLGTAGDGLASKRPDGPAPTVREYGSETAEAEAVAAEIFHAHLEGRPWSHMAVLVRTNAQAVPLRRALEAAGIPCRTSNRDGLMTHAAAIAALTELGTRPSQPIQVAIADLTAMAEDARGTGGANEPVPTPERQHAATGDTDATASSDATADGGATAATLACLAALARDYADLDDRGSIGGFLAWLPSAAGREAEGTGPNDAVTICSFHRAKGLEWDSVWLCGLERGLVPISQATTASAEAEERRLLYVAITRAKRSLHGSWATRRTFGGHAVPREPSPWLTALGGDLSASSSPPPIDVATWRSKLATQRDHLRTSPAPRRPRAERLGPADPAIVERLRRWRTERARAAGVPAHVLLHDRTLEVLATIRPQSTDELLGVPGLGPVKAARFGPALLELCADHSATG
jgi:DNA helicase-2/ATP-dependent DNA helicase PcrA